MITLRHTTLSRTPLDEGSARRRGHWHRHKYIHIRADASGIYIYIFISISKSKSISISVYVSISISVYVPISVSIYLYRVSQEECAILRDSVPYVKLYRYNPKHLHSKLNVYGDNGQRKVWTSCISAFYTPTAVSRATPPSSHLTACGAYVG